MTTTTAGKHLLNFAAWSLAACTCVMLPATAHHSSTNFDISKQYIFHGTVRKFLWQNPHVWLYVTVRKADGTDETWGFEANGPNVLSRIGWNAADFKEGDKVIVYGNPERDGKHNALMAKIQLGSGRVLLGSPDYDKPAETGERSNGLPPPPKVTPVEYK